jgi:hypothetical protein
MGYVFAGLMLFGVIAAVVVAFRRAAEVEREEAERDKFLTQRGERDLDWFDRLQW